MYLKDQHKIGPRQLKWEVNSRKLNEISEARFFEALMFERKELIAERPNNKQVPWVYIPKYNPHLRNLRKTLTKAGTK